MMRYEIRYDGGQRFVLASNDDEALNRFRAGWETYGDPAPACWIAARWAIG